VPSYPVTLVFRDGEVARVECRSFETVVQAAARQRIGLLVDCREGGCGTCKASLQSGRYSLDDYSQDALPDEELAEGRVLACRMRPESPCVVEFDYPIEAVRRGAPAAPWAAKIISIEPQASDVVAITIEADDRKPFDFLPGQYANLQVAGTDIVRSYSFVNQPGETHATFLLRLIPGGALSEWIRSQAKPGVALQVSGPFGRFFLRDPDKPMVFVAGGTGIGPIISILDQMRTSRASPPSVKLVFGVNTLASLFWRERLDALIASFAGSELVTAVMSPEGAWDGVAGTAVDGLMGLAIDPSSHVYLCGPPVMTEAAQKHLHTRGIAERAIFAEAFLPAVGAKAA